ncbi:MAG: 8-amino-7-oxononanoate synthase [Gammaproteobacteria bacterium]|nr:8-amino-7-oxononanoate synthase [Gammaproteobacteria bacterium]
MVRLQQQLAEKRAHDLYRQRKVIGSPQQVELLCNGKALLSFCSNDYLGLANHPDIARAMKRGIDRWGVGSGAAHLITGHTAAHHAFEEELAEWLGRERALLFSTGYMANIGVISALTRRGDQLFEDRLNHASLIDGGLASAAAFHRYRHADTAMLDGQLRAVESGNRMVVSDGVFSMDGDMAPLPQLTACCEQHDALLMIDDAHGIGVLGKQGVGCSAGYTQQQVPVLMATLGKAFGVFGAFVAGSETLIETLIQDARSWIYTTAPPAAMAEALREALKIVISDEWRRDHLRQLISRFRQGAGQLGLPLMPSETPIQPLVAGDADRALRWSHALAEHGILVTAIRPPTVPQDSARLRITFSATHTAAHVDRLLEALEQIQRQDH